MNSFCPSCDVYIAYNAAVCPWCRGPCIVLAKNLCLVNTNAYICRATCEHYDRKNDRCLEVIRLGKEKGVNRAGKIAWLHSHPSARCPIGKYDGPTSPTRRRELLARALPVIQPESVDQTSDQSVLD